MLRTISPSGAPIRLRDLMCGIKAELCREDSSEIFEQQIKNYYGVNHAFLLSSGKAALYVALKALTSLSNRRDVIIPAYSSFCLASALARAGVSVKLCDVDPEYLDFDLDHLNRLIDERTLAVVPVHLFGLVTRFDEIAEIAHSKRVFIIEDAAQAMGAEYKGRKVGTLGDIAIFSLGRGKTVSTIEGGILVTNNQQIAESVTEHLKQLTDAKRINLFITGLAISFLLNPKFYGIPNNLPFLNLGANIYDPNFKIHLFTRMQAGIAESIFDQLEIYNDMRYSNFDFLFSRLKNVSEVNLIKINHDAKSSYIRFPIVCKDFETRENIFYKLKKAKLGASKNFPHPLSKLKGFKNHLLNRDDSFVQSHKLCQTLLTIPTHPYVTEKDLNKMVSIITY